jgi:hypothetical protein
MFKLLGKNSTALEMYQVLEKELDDASQGLNDIKTIAKAWKFVPEKEKRQMNPINPANVDETFGKELAKQKMTVFTYKQWLLWNKLKCLGELKAHYLSATMAEYYLRFVQKYQLINGVPEILRAIMVLQTCHMLTEYLKADIDKIVALPETSVRFFYSCLARLYFQKKQCLHKVVQLVYSMTPLPMKEQHERTIQLLTYLTTTKVYNENYILGRSRI